MGHHHRSYINGTLFICGSLSGLVASFIADKRNNVEPVETFRLLTSAEDVQELIRVLISGLLTGLKSGFMAGLLFGLIVGVVFSLGAILNFGFEFVLKAFVDGLLSGVLFGLRAGLMFGCFFGLMSGLITGFQSEFKTRDNPNQGILASAKNIPFITLCTYPFGIFLSHTLAFLGGGHVIWQTSFAEGLCYALILSFLAGGGLQILRHGLLRSFLCQQGHIPHNYAQFLKYTTERRLTQQIGGRFRFIHRELLDHFDPVDRSTSKAP